MDATCQRARQQAQLRQPQQPLGRLGQRAEAIAQLLAEIVEPVQLADARQPAIDLDPQLLARHVVARQIRRPGQIDVTSSGVLQRHVASAARTAFSSSWQYSS